jgi:cytochrome c biogenesis protein CcmG/thiol:disulfide interchange protein DsbE
MTDTEPSSKKDERAAAPEAQKRSFGVLLPLGIFAALAGLFFIALSAGDPSSLPSALIGKPVPQFSLPPLNAADTASSAQGDVSSAALGNGKPAIVHFFASWCGPCREEHPAVMALAEKLREQNPGIPFFGINYKDDATAARRFLGSYGDPYTHIGVDRSGRTAIDFGVYGVPEIYVIAGDGTVLFRHAGPLTKEAVETSILPLMQTGASPATTGQRPSMGQEPSG